MIYIYLCSLKSHLSVSYIFCIDYQNNSILKLLETKLPENVTSRNTSNIRLINILYLSLRFLNNEELLDIDL